MTDFNFQESERQIIFFGAQIAHKHFSGEAEKVNGKIFHKAGDRDFSIIIPVERKDIADTLADEGFNIKQSINNESGETRFFYLPRVKVSYQIKPPMVMIVDDEIDPATGKNKTRVLQEKDISMLDQADIVSVNVAIDRHFYESDDGRKLQNGYVATLAIKIQSDPVLAMYQ